MGKMVPFSIVIVACFLILLDVWVLSPEHFGFIPKIILSLSAVIIITLCFVYRKSSKVVKAKWKG